MSVTVYEPTGIVHSVIAHLGDTRAMTSVVHLTQYDNTLPIIAVKLMNGAQPYKIPESATVSIRVGKPDKTGVYNPCLGVSSDYTTAYFAATEQMCAADGKAFAVVEIIDGGTASTGIFVIDIAENPVNDETVLSDSELGIVQGLVDSAEASANASAESASKSAASASASQASAEASAGSAEDALQSEQNASQSEANALQHANKAEQEATTAEQARDTAEEYMEKAQASSAVSNSSYYIGDDGMLHLNFNSEGLGKNDIDQKLSALQSDVEGLQSATDSLSETVTDQASEITELQGDVAELQNQKITGSWFFNNNIPQSDVIISKASDLTRVEFGTFNDADAGVYLFTFTGVSIQGGNANTEIFSVIDGQTTLLSTTGNTDEKKYLSGTGIVSFGGGRHTIALGLRVTQSTSTDVHLKAYSGIFVTLVKVKNV